MFNNKNQVKSLRGSPDAKMVSVTQGQPDRVTTTQKIIDGFTAKTGIKVKLVAIDDSQVVQLTESAALSGKMPDVMGALSLAEVRQFASLKLVNTDAAAAIVKNLGADTFVKSVASSPLATVAGERSSIWDTTTSTY